MSSDINKKVINKKISVYLIEFVTIIAIMTDMNANPSKSQNIECFRHSVMSMFVLSLLDPGCAANP